MLSVLCFASAPAGAQAARPELYHAPSITYGELYRDVELAAIFLDSKIFPDMIPDAAPAAVLDEYRAAKGSPAFDLTTFVQQHFTGPTAPQLTVDGKIKEGEVALALFKLEPDPDRPHVLRLEWRLRGDMPRPPRYVGSNGATLLCE